MSSAWTEPGIWRPKPSDVTGSPRRIALDVLQAKTENDPRVEIICESTQAYT